MSGDRPKPAPFELISHRSRTRRLHHHLL